MVNDVPNFAFIIGYFSLAGQSWTCRADIAAFFFTKMLNYMRKNNITKLVPKEYSQDDHDSGSGGAGTQLNEYLTRTRPFLGHPNPTFPGRVGTRPYPNPTF